MKIRSALTITLWLAAASFSFAQNIQKTTLADNLSSGSQTVYLFSSAIPSSLAHGYLYIDSEAMQVTQSTQNINTTPTIAILTVNRGILGTTTASHLAGATVYFGIPSQFLTADVSGGCTTGSPQYLNVSDQKWFDCSPPGLWTGLTTIIANGGSGSGNVATSGNMVNGNVPDATGATTLADGGQPYPASAFVGISDTQTLTNKSIDASEINSGTLSALRFPATTVTPGSYTNVNLTVGADGRITAAANGSGGGSGWSVGTFASMPFTCSVGAGYFATDQPAGQQLYTCSATNVWTQMVGLGSSGALAVTSGSLDIVTSVVPRLAAANAFTGLNTFASVLITPVAFASLPTCNSGATGTHRWITDSTVNTWGSAVTVGGGSDSVGVACDGSSWTVYAK